MLDTSLIEALQERFQGEIIRPSEAGYDDARTIWNRMIDKYPALIARCTNSTDVIEAVNFARDNDLLLSVRGGGHNVVGSAVCDGGLMIDLSLMKDIHVDPQGGTATAQPGVVFGELDRTTQPYGLAVPGGVDDQGECRCGDVVRHICDEEKIGITKGIVEGLYRATDGPKQLFAGCASTGAALFEQSLESFTDKLA